MTAPWTESNPAPFCVSCEEYRVIVPGQSCPICVDELRKEAAK